MFRVGRAENIVAIFGEQDNDHQADPQVKLSLCLQIEKNVQQCMLRQSTNSDLFSNFFGLEKLDKVPREVFTPELQKVRLQMSHANYTLDKRHHRRRGLIQWRLLQDLLLLEEQEGSVNFKFGVIYAREGQITDDEMLSNGKTIRSVGENKRQSSGMGN